MRALLTIFVPITISFAYGSDDGTWMFISGKVGPDSIANKSKLKQLHEVIMEEIESKRSNKDSLRIINEKIKGLKLPEIDTNSENLKISIAHLSGFASSSDVGAQIRDGKHRYCLPCQIGHNKYMIGVFKYEMSPRNPEGKFYPVLKCFEKIQSQYIGYLSGYVNSQNWPQKKFLSAAISNGKHEGALVVTDEEVNFYNYTFPEDHYSYQKIELSNEKVVELRWDKNEYGSIKQPSFSENPQFVPPKTWEAGTSKDFIQPSEELSTTEADSMVISTLKKQMDRLLGPGYLGYSPSKEWQCDALDHCSQLKASLLFNDEANIRNASELFSSWSEISKQSSCK